MASLWTFIAKPKNRQVLSWVGGGIVAVAAGAWAAVTYIWPAHEPAHAVCAQPGAVAAGRDISGSIITTTNSGQAPAVGAPCVDDGKK